MQKNANTTILTSSTQPSAIRPPLPIRKGRIIKKTHQVTDNNPDSSDSDFAFCLRSDCSDIGHTPTVNILLNGIKGRADSCASANIMNKETLSKIQAKVPEKVELKPATTKLNAYAQKEPMKLAGCFNTNIKNAQTAVTAEFLVVHGRTRSRPLLY